MLNKVILIGRITKDVELRRTSSDTPVVSFTIAVDKRRSNQGDSNQTADFINCVAWERIAEVMDQYVRKGMLLAIEGRIQTRSYENNEGVRVYTTEVVCNSMQMLESKNSQQNKEDSFKGLEKYEPNNKPKEEKNDEEAFEIDDDELPF